MKQTNIDKLFNFLKIAEDLKETIRWSEHKSMKKKDSSASHSWKMSLMIIAIVEEYKIKINLEKTLKMAIVHDLPETITGDIDSVLIASGVVTKKQKLNNELMAMKKIRNISPTKTGKKIYSLWHEFEEKKLVKPNS